MALLLPVPLLACGQQRMHAAVRPGPAAASAVQQALRVRHAQREQLCGAVGLVAQLLHPGQIPHRFLSGAQRSRHQSKGAIHSSFSDFSCCIFVLSLQILVSAGTLICWRCAFSMQNVGASCLAPGGDMVWVPHRES